MINFVKKTFEKIDEYKKANALAEQAKNRLADLKCQIQKIEKELKSMENVISEKENNVKEREDAIIVSENTTIKNLRIVSGKLNETIIILEKKIVDLDKEKTIAITEFEKASYNLSNKNDEYDNCVIKLDEIKLEIIIAKKKLRDAKEDTEKAKSLKDKTNEETELLRKESAEIIERKTELDLYARRIQRYYDEVKISIKI